MGILDAVGDLGSAIADRASSFASAVGGAASFAADVAIGVGEKVASAAGSAGERALEFAADVAKGPMGVVASGAIALGKAIANPQAFVSHAVDSAQSMVSKAFHTGSGIVSKVMSGVHEAMDVAGKGALHLAKTIAKGVSAGISNVAHGVADTLRKGFAFATQGAKKAMGILAELAKKGLSNLPMVRLGLIRRIVAGLTHLATNAARRVAQATAKVVQKASLAALKAAGMVANKVEKVAQKAADKTHRVAAGVAKAAQTATQIVQKAVAWLAPHLPGPLGGLLQKGGFYAGSFVNKIGNLAKNVIDGVARATSSTGSAIRRGILATVGHAVSEGMRLELEFISLIMRLREIKTLDLAEIGEKLVGAIQVRAKAIKTGVVSIVSGVANTLGTVAHTVAKTVPAIAGYVAGGAQHLVKAAEEKVIAGVGIVKKVGRAAKEGLGSLIPKGILKGIGGVVAGVRSFTNRVVDGVLHKVGDVLGPITHFSQKKLPHDGELTGPFYPQPADDDEGPPNAESLHAEHDEATRRAALKSGARIFVNGIDTTLANHYAAAQRLANELNKPVVGIYNATGGKGNDLLQCAADKLFDRTNNPAIATLTGILEEQGQGTGKSYQNKIFAHSQGSLIVSEALRQAGKAGANLQQYEVTTFGNAAWTFPRGPKYHHYVHDDDLVPALAGTTSRISYLMNQTRIGRWLAERALGPLSDAQKDTTILHQGGSFISPHSINATKDDGRPDKAEQVRDYLGHRKLFESEESKTGKRTNRHRAMQTSVGFAIARGVGQMISDGVAGGYRRLDRAVRMAAPILGGNAASLLWSGMSRRMAAVGTGIYEAGVVYGSVVDSQYRSLTKVQRDGTGPDPDVDAAVLKTKLDRAGSTGSTPDTNLQQKLGGLMGFDISIARVHSDPAAAAAATDLGARAFTIGRDVYFAPGEYNPGSTEGMALMAHELTHVAQQTGGVGNPLRHYTRQGGDSMELEAQRMASFVSANLGDHNGLFVERYSRTYDSDRGLSQEQLTRLEMIATMAIERAGEALGSRAGTIDQLRVNVSIDLNEMDDQEASAVWAEAILSAARTAAVAEAEVPSSVRVQRTPFVTQLHMPATPPPQAGEMEGDDRMVRLEITIFGEHFGTVTYPEALRGLRNTYRFLRGQVQAGEESHHDFIDFRNDHWFTGGVSDLVGGVSMPSITIWHTPAHHLERAYEALVNRDVDAALRHLTLARQSLDDCQHQISAYREGTISGAGHTITGLETVRTGSAIVVGTLATAGMGTGAALAVGVGYGAAQTVASQATEVSLGLRDEIDWAGIAFDALIGLLVGRFLGNFGNRIAGRLLSNPQFQTMTRAALVRIVQDVVTGRASSIVSRAARQIFDHARGSHEAMTFDQFMNSVVDELCDPRSYFFDIMSGMGGRAAERHRATTTGASVHSTPEAMDTRVGRAAQEVLDVPPPRRESSSPPPTDTPAPTPPPAPTDAPPATATPPVPTDTPPPAPAPAAPAAHPAPEATAAPSASAPPEAATPHAPAADTPPAPAHPGDAAPEASTPHRAEAESSSTSTGEPSVSTAAPAEAAAAGHPDSTPPTAATGTPESTAPIDRRRSSTDRRRGESAAGRRRRVMEEVRAAEEGRTTPEAEAAARPTEAAAESTNPRAEEAMRQHGAAVNAGGEAGVAAAEQLIRQVGSFRALREMATRGLLTPAGVQAIEQARAAIQARIRQTVLANHPNVEIPEPTGTAGFGSDSDITVRPRGASEFTTPEQVAQGVRDAGAAVAEANRLAREYAGGGEPDQTLDTNYYSYTGADSQVTRGAPSTRASRDARTVASLAEQHQAMSPEAWTDYREQILREAAPGREDASEAQRSFERQAREELRAQLDAAETMSNRLRDQREALARSEMATDPTLSPEAADMRARERLASTYRRRLVAALSRSPVDHAEVSTLQAQITMIEPGAYASAAGIADVPFYQQALMPRSGDATVPVRSATGEPVTAGTTADGEPIPLTQSEGSRRYIDLDPVTGARDLADSAGSSLAQLEAHSAHAPTTVAGALDAIKNVFKYCGRIQHADEAVRAGTTPDPAAHASGLSRPEQPLGALETLAGSRLDTVGGLPRESVLSMLRGEVPSDTGRMGPDAPTTPDQARQRAIDAIVAESRGRGYGGSLQEMATNFTNQRLEWARSRVASLRVRAATAEIAHRDPDEERSSGGSTGGSR